MSRPSSTLGAPSFLENVTRTFVQTPTNPVASPLKGGDFISLSGRIRGRRWPAATAPVEMAHCEAHQQRNVANTAAKNDVPYEMATTEKTPGPGGGTRRQRPNPRPSVQVEEQEAARPTDRPRSGESVSLPGTVLK
ncbi:hypothetical protein NDU88_000977 [Pleurodeles waltl]|uniref:Uncharacterized protein n=1 Tax=Pleurodeles waltl TaxID=8319 RepID=A0AAV7WMX3_PLEWA|nr:hypothetical protein NDU88_000977 [Pleurodeles waltl]